MSRPSTSSSIEQRVQDVDARHKGEHDGGFPPFNSQTFASQLIWLAIAFILLYVLMAKWALPQVGRVIDNRQKRIAGDIAEAGGLKEQSDAAVAAYETALADARARAQGIANETREKQAAAADDDLVGMVNERLVADMVETADQCTVAGDDPVALGGGEQATELGLLSRPGLLGVAIDVHEARVVCSLPVCVARVRPGLLNRRWRRGSRRCLCA